jgi:hypothetical protein
MPVAALSWTWLIPLRSMIIMSVLAKNWVREGLVRALGMAVSMVAHYRVLRLMIW